MKVLYISYDGMSDPLGQSQVLPYLRGLSEKGCDITLLSLEKSSRLAGLKSKIEKDASSNDIDWHYCIYRRRKTTVDPLLNMFSLKKEAKRLQKQKIFQIVHCRGYMASFIGLSLKKKYGIKFIFDMRGFWADEKLQGGSFERGLIYKFLKRAEGLFIKGADAIISLTENAVSEMKSWPYFTVCDAKKMFCINTCVDIDRYALTYRERLSRTFNKNKVTFVYVGSIGPYHSFDAISSFVKCVYEHVPGSCFNMMINCGADELLRYIEEEGLDPKRFNIRSVDHESVSWELKDADVGFFFIPPVYSKRSSSPTKMGEMMAAGIPVVTGHSIGDVDAIVHEYKVGYIVKDFTVQEYENAVDFVIEQILSEREKLTARCLEAAKDKFSLKKGVDEYFRIYENLTVK